METESQYHGKNGIGKSSILKLIIGEKIQFNGELKIANDLKNLQVKIKLMKAFLKQCYLKWDFLI